MPKNTERIPLSDAMVNNIKTRMKELGLSKNELCRSSTYDHKSITDDQYKAIMSFREKKSNSESKTDLKRSHEIYSIDREVFLVLHDNLKCTKDYLLGKTDKADEAEDGRKISFPVEFYKPKAQNEIKEKTKRLWSYINDIKEPLEIDLLHFIFCEVNPTTRYKIISDLSEYLKKHKEMVYPSEKWQESPTNPEKAAALSMIYSIATDDIKDVLDKFFDAEAFYYERDYDKAIPKYAAVIIEFLEGIYSPQIKPFGLDSVYRLKQIRDNLDDPDKYTADLEKAELFFSKEFGDILEELIEIHYKYTGVTQPINQNKEKI